MRHEERCKNIVAEIETLSQTEVEELFRMIHKNNYTYTRNNHGVFINLLWLPENMIALMEKYIDFCHRSKVELQKYESICDVLNTRLQEQKKKQQPVQQAEYCTPVKSVIAHQEPVVEKNTKVSTSLRFYLLKKKFAKTIALPNNYESDLKPEDYKVM